jgi:hypothetical protein
MSKTPPPQEGPFKTGGCLTPLLMVLLLGGLLAVGGLFLGLRYAADQIIGKISQSAPVALPVLDVTPEQIAAVNERFGAFQKAWEKEEQGATLILRGQELQALLFSAEGEEWKSLKDKVFISILEDRLRCDLTFPPGRILMKEYPGKFINGFLEWKFLNAGEGDVRVSVESARLGSLQAPKQLLGAMGSSLNEITGNLDKKEAEPLERFLRKVAKAEVAGGTLTITLK